MDLTQDDVIRIMKIINESDFDELQLEMGDLKIVLSKQGSATSVEQHEAPSTTEKSLPISNLNTQSTAGNDPVPQESAAFKATGGNKSIIVEWLNSKFKDQEAM